jgi:septal ring factor EnvC (AmiA/AmiB activator)
MRPSHSRTFPPSPLPGFGAASALLHLTFALCLLTWALFVAPHESSAQASPDAQRISERIRVLEREATRLAGEAQTLVGDLRKREVDRSLKVEQLKQAEAQRAETERALQQTTDRLSELELQRIDQLPDIKAQLVGIYKRGRTGYARLLFGASDLRELARASRAVSAMTAITERRLAEHERTMAALRQETAAFSKTARELQEREAAARRAKAASDRAVAAASELIAQIDSRRDLTAQYVGELQVAYNRIQQQVAALSSGKPADPVAVPLRPFQGALDWPAQGRVIGAFGQPSDRLGGSLVRNGIEIGAVEDAPVRAVHGGTVGFAGPFTGFGTLVILDHGGNSYSLYGYLESTELQQGQAVETGAEIGRVGAGPAGPPALYFELRIDGRSVNPVQWLKPPIKR